MTTSLPFKKRIEKKLLSWESAQSFNPSWFGVFVNPFYISRSHLYRHFAAYGKSVGTGKSILDVGCGIKPYEKLFAGNEYIGIEASQSGHADEAKNANVLFDGVRIPFDANRFDIAIASEVFEHVQELPELTKDIYRVLKPGGMLFISMPFVWPEHEKPYDFRRFTSFGHIQSLERAGFKVTQIEQTSGVFGTCAQVISDFIIDRANTALSKHTLAGFRYKLKFVAMRLVIAFICAPVQLCGLFFDHIFNHAGLTLDHIVTAQKP